MNRFCHIADGARVPDETDKLRELAEIRAMQVAAG